MKIKKGTLTKEELEKQKREDLEFLVLNLQDALYRMSKNLEEVEKENANLKEIRKLLTSTIYSPSSEQMGSLFDEVDLYNKALPEFSNEDEEKILVKEHYKRKNIEISKCPANTPVYDVDHTGGAKDSYIDESGIEYVRVADEIVNKLAYIPQKVVVERHHYAKYEAKCVVENDKQTVVRMNNRLIDATAASPSFISYLAVAKYDDHLPLYRLSEILNRSGIKVSRQKMAQWMLKYSEALASFSLYWDKMTFRQNFLAMDESPLKILDVKGKEGKPSNNCFMMFRKGSSYDSKERTTHVLISFKACIGRSKEELLDDYNRSKFPGYVMTDGLSGYKSIKNHCNCWVHAVRGFKNLLKINSECEEAKHICTLAAKLYKIEDKYRAQLNFGSITPSEFLSKRKEESLPIMNTIFEYCYSLSLKATPKSQMGRALAYINDRVSTLPNYLEVVEASPSNNESERLAKAFATGRKNWIFSKVIDGADASAFFYSIIESAKANGLDPLLYMELICTKGPYCKNEEEMERLLPWNADLTSIKKIADERSKATPDFNRHEPYVFTGLRR